MKQLLVCATAVLLAACSGDGDPINPNVAGVDTATAGTPMYGQDLVITLKGRNLDKPIAAGADTGCSSLARSTTEPYVSTVDTAYYLCTRPTIGTHQAVFGRSSDSVLLATVPFTVPLPQVTLTVSNGAGVAGQLVLTLEAVKAPLTVDNFLAYVKAGFYVDTVVHRVVPGFILQGGGYAQPLVAGGTVPELKATNPAIALEDNAGLSNLKGTVAMARTSAPASATSQFFFNLVDNTSLDRNGAQRGYAVFGTLSTGADLLTAMAAAPCAAWPAFFGNDPGACLPSPNLVITAAAQTR